MTRVFSLYLVFLLFYATNVAQTIQFQLADPQPDLIEVYGGSMASGEIGGARFVFAAGMAPPGQGPNNQFLVAHFRRDHD